MTLEKLGKLLDAAIERMARRGRRALAERLAEMARKGEWHALRAWAASGHLGAQLRAWALHSAWLDIPTLPPAGVQGLLAERSLAFAEDVVARVSAVYGSGKGLPMDPRLYVRLIADVATRRGFSEGAEAAAREAGAAWKVWVRVYPARHSRDWHAALEGKTVLEREKFVLPGGPNAGRRVDAPHDWDAVPDPAEWVNCGHAVIYVPSATWRDVMRR